MKSISCGRLRVNHLGLPSYRRTNIEAELLSTRRCSVASLNPCRGKLNDDAYPACDASVVLPRHIGRSHLEDSQFGLDELFLLQQQLGVAH